jgi:hypothetical protein
MNKLMSVEVKGKTKLWSFEFYGDPKYLDEWREDGLEVNEIIYTVPVSVVNAGLAGVWMKAQDIFNFRFKR